jgi:hypothetical protein
LARERGESRPARDQVTPRLPETTPPPVVPSGDYTYTLEIVMNMQLAMGKLMEAVESLKSHSRDHGDKLEEVRRDVHGAKVALRVIAAVAVALSAFVGWILSRAWDVVFKSLGH